MRRWAIALVAATLAVSAPQASGAAEITILAGQGVAASLRDVAIVFERETGHRVVVRQEDDLPSGVDTSASADLVAASPAAVDHYIARGKVVAGTRIDFARAGVGVVVKTGAARPDISTPQAFRLAMLAARSIAYSRGASGVITHAVMERLGITDQIRDRTVRTVNVPIAELVARGDAEIGLHQINTILPVRGADYVGPLPPGLQDYVPYTLGTLVVSRQQAAARAFARFASAPEHAAILRTSGMEPWER